MNLVKYDHTFILAARPASTPLGASSNTRLCSASERQKCERDKMRKRSAELASLTISGGCSVMIGPHILSRCSSTEGLSSCSLIRAKRKISGSGLERETYGYRYGYRCGYRCGHKYGHRCGYRQDGYRNVYRGRITRTQQLSDILGDPVTTIHTRGGVQRGA